MLFLFDCLPIIEKKYFENYRVNGFPLKSATWRALQCEMLSGISYTSKGKKTKSQNFLKQIPRILKPW